MSYEADLIRKITGGISGIKNKTKTPAEAKLGSLFKSLKEINIGQHDELMNNYKAALETLKKE
jgi:hypothetical protein